MYRYIKAMMYLREATTKRTKRTGPNDAKRVVWAIGEFFLMLFMFFITTNHVTGILKLQMRFALFGPLVSFFLHYSCFL